MSRPYTNDYWHSFEPDREMPTSDDAAAVYYTDGAIGQAVSYWYDDPVSSSAFGEARNNGGDIPDSNRRQPSYTAMNHADPWNMPASAQYRRRRGWHPLLIVGLILLVALLIKPLAIASFILGFALLVPLILLAMVFGIIGLILRLIFGWPRWYWWRPWGWFSPWGYWWAGPPLFWMGLRRWYRRPYRWWWDW
jgi:hypothetical protein